MARGIIGVLPLISLKEEVVEGWVNLLSGPRFYIFCDHGRFV